jgi:hypothetical protein
MRSYSANEISKFTNEEIQRIIDRFTEKPNMDFTDDQDTSIDDSSGQTSASEVQANPLVSAEVSVSTAPNSLTHVFSSDDNSSVIPNYSTRVDYEDDLLTKEIWMPQIEYDSNEIRPYECEDIDEDSEDEEIPEDSDDYYYDGYDGGYYYRNRQ